MALRSSPLQLAQWTRRTHSNVVGLVFSRLRVLVVTSSVPLTLYYPGSGWSAHPRSFLALFVHGARYRCRMRRPPTKLQGSGGKSTPIRFKNSIQRAQSNLFSFVNPDHGVCERARSRRSTSKKMDPSTTAGTSAFSNFGERMVSSHHTPCASTPS